MSKDIEELRFVADLAHSGGMMQAENEYLKKDNAKLQTENEQLKNDNMQLRTEIGKLKDENRLMRAEMDVLRSTPPQGQPTVVVNNYYLLSMPKTSNYVRALDNEGRLFVGHFMHHTLSDGTPQSVFAQVDEMTQLAARQDDRLVNAMEELARKPTTQNNYGDYVEGDKVEDMTVVPYVENYKPEIQTQSNSFATPATDEQENKLLEE